MIHELQKCDVLILEEMKGKEIEESDANSLTALASANNSVSPEITSCNIFPLYVGNVINSYILTKRRKFSSLQVQKIKYMNQYRFQVLYEKNLTHECYYLLNTGYFTM